MNIPKEGLNGLEFSCDSYEWVSIRMFRYGFLLCGMTMRKPYVSSSNYVLNMSDFKKGDWSEKWNELYKKFVISNKTKLWPYRYHFPTLTAKKK